MELAYYIPLWSIFSLNVGTNSTQFLILREKNLAYNKDILKIAGELERCLREGEKRCVRKSHSSIKALEKEIKVLEKEIKGLEKKIKIRAEAMYRKYEKYKKWWLVKLEEAQKIKQQETLVRFSIVSYKTRVSTFNRIKFSYSFPAWHCHLFEKKFQI